MNRVHAVLEHGGGVVYLGSRVSRERDPCGLVNVGHVGALLRGGGEVLDPRRGVVVVYVEGQPAQRWRLHADVPGDGPVIIDLLSRWCRCGVGLDAPAGMECWLPHLDPEPDEVDAVVICGQDPGDRHVVRCEDGAGWRERGTRPHRPGAVALAWEQVGRCAAGGPHPVRRLGL